MGWLVAHDVWPGLTAGQADPDLILQMFQHYMATESRIVGRRQFLDNLAAKQAHAAFLSDIDPLLAEGVGFDMETAVGLVRDQLVTKLP